MDFAYTKEFEFWRYSKISMMFFGILTLAFISMSFLQSAVSYSANASFTSEVLGCSTSYGANPLQTACGYFFHNVAVALIAWLGGIAMLGPFYVLWSNAETIGTYIVIAIQNPGSITNGTTGTIGALAFLLPHGIIEIPAIMMSVGLGLYMAEVVFENRKRKEDYDIWNSLYQTTPWALVIIGMLGIAAFIEANFSLQIAAFMEANL